MAAVQWKFLLADSGSYNNIGELTQARNRQLSLTLNKSGTLSFTIPMNDDLGYQIYPLTHCVKALRRGIDGVWRSIWSGPVWTIDEDISGERMTVNAVGWMQMLEKRALRRDKIYTAINGAGGGPWTDADIILDLLADANATNITWDTNFPGGYAVPLMSGATTPTNMTAGTKTGTFQNRTISYTKGANILQELLRLTDIESGCDIEVDPSSAARPLNLFQRKMTDRTGVVFGYKWGPNNLQQLTRQFDPSTIVNYIYVAGSSTVAPAYADTKTFPAPTQNPPKLGENSQTSYGLWEETVSLPDVNDLSVLQTYAAGEVLVRSSPRIMYGLTPFPFVESKKGQIPEPFVEYTLGDKIYFSARSGRRVNINKQAARIFGMSVSIDENGNETLGQLQVSPS
jgi:hypothetical protein